MVALLCPSTIEGLPLSNILARVADRIRSQSRTRKELLLLISALTFGLFLLPWLIWAVGQAVLGPYAKGGAFQFVGDFFSGLAQGSAVFWIVALGPAFFLLTIRLMLNLPRAAGSDAQRGQ